MGGSGGLGRVCSWWSAARPAGGAGSCRFPAGAALPGPPPHVPGPGWGLTGCQLSAGGRPDPPQGLRRGRPGGPIWAADGGSASEPAAGFSGAGGLPDRRGGSGGAAGDVPPGPGPRWRRAPRVAAGTTAGCCRLALLPGWRARPAVAAGTMPGMAPGGTLDGAGSGPGSDPVLVTAGRGGCQLVVGRVCRLVAVSGPLVPGRSGHGQRRGSRRVLARDGHRHHMRGPGRGVHCGPGRGSGRPAGHAGRRHLLVTGRRAVGRQDRPVFRRHHVHRCCGRAGRLGGGPASGYGLRGQGPGNAVDLSATAAAQDSDPHPLSNVCLRQVSITR
jgi:hypothetical protein